MSVNKTMRIILLIFPLPIKVLLVDNLTVEVCYFRIKL